jgi:glycosyltransferase involved in cell wall biosynthesis
MRILAVGEMFPWPPNGGGLIRWGKAIEALSELGDLDLFTLRDVRRTDLDVPPFVKLSRLMTAPYQVPAPWFPWRAAWMARRGRPIMVVRKSFDPAPRRAFESWVADRYDLVWFSTAAMFEWMGRPKLGTTVIDVDNLEDEKEKLRARIIWSTKSGGVIDGVHRWAAFAQTSLNARDWNSFQRSVAADVDRVLLCTDQDVARSGIPNAVVVPNTYQRPVEPVGHEKVGVPPVILFQGSLNYAPNVDAAEWLVREIAPCIRSQVPGAEIRLVGRANLSVERLHRPPDVTVTGRVPEMEPELAQADLAVVPIRYGSGTRLKILESFAHRVPVVSTTIGAEGLEVEDGVHLLLADRPDEFAAACKRLLTQPELRKNMVDAAEQRYLERYEWSSARDRIRALVHELVGDGSPGRR